MKNNRCRDPQGLVNEIFKTTVAGVDMQKALLLLVNKTKETHEIPNMMKKCKHFYDTKARKIKLS